ncbi:putative NBD/HSP70 family sugar kinase [Rhizobium sp. BK060]|nr:ROK family transcriptional regulator [Rhizobium sp. BK060]MBB3398803.1 putative NBD/HSP70 family sugar kinase [Rhizobium sp. BK060]
MVLSLVRRHIRLSKVELTRLTSLAPQTITTIVNRMADQGLLTRLTPLRNKLGQPSTPYSLAHDGAYSFGLSISRNMAAAALVNFLGEPLDFETTTFEFPTPAGVMNFAKSFIENVSRKRRGLISGKVAGLGIASPFYLKNWAGLDDARGSVLEEWRRIDIRAELDPLFEWPVYLYNDAIVSAAAELIFGAGLGINDFVYAYIGQEVGGAVVLDHHVFPGSGKLAGSLGSMPVLLEGKDGCQVSTLGEVGSLSGFSRTLGLAPESLLDDDVWLRGGEALDLWIDAVSTGLAHVARSIVALLDVDNLFVDGSFPVHVRKGIARETRRKLMPFVFERQNSFSVMEGSFGKNAPTIGAASIALLVKYSNGKDVLFKD